MQIRLFSLLIIGMIASTALCQNEVDALKNEISNLEGKIRELEQQNATYKEIRMYQVRLFGKKQSLEEMQGQRPGIDKPIENGLEYIRQTFENFDKYSPNKELNSRFIIKTLEGRVMSLEGFVIGSDFFPSDVEEKLSSEIYEDRVFGLIFNKTYTAAPKLRYHVFDMNKLCINLNANSVILNSDIDEKILPYVRKVTHEGKYGKLPHVRIVIEGEIKCEYNGDKPDYLYLDDWYVKEVIQH
jgi:hypothetical protein